MLGFRFLLSMDIHMQKTVMCGLFVFALLAGCSSPPKLKVPDGDWENFNPPSSSTMNSQQKANGGQNAKIK